MNVGRTALITGATGGIGEALVRQFADAGYTVIGTDFKQPKTFNGSAFVDVDLYKLCHDQAVASRFFSEIAANLENARLDVLINNAAMQIVAPIENISHNQWRELIDINVTAPFFLAQGLLELLTTASGSIINISSIHAELTNPGFTAYATSKAALSGLTRALGVELGGRVRVNAIAPAAIETAMLKAGFSDSPGKYDQLRSFHPTQNIGTPLEVARLALFMASPESSFMNGAVVPLNGGIGARLYDPE